MPQQKIQAEIFEEIENIVPRYPLDHVSKEELDEKMTKISWRLSNLPKYANFQYVTCVVLIYFQNT